MCGKELIEQNRIDLIETIIKDGKIKSIETYEFGYSLTYIPEREYDQQISIEVIIRNANSSIMVSLHRIINVRLHINHNVFDYSSSPFDIYLNELIINKSEEHYYKNISDDESLKMNLDLIFDRISEDLFDYNDKQIIIYANQYVDNHIATIYLREDSGIFKVSDIQYNTVINIESYNLRRAFPNYMHKLENLINHKLENN